MECFLSSGPVLLDPITMDLSVRLLTANSEREDPCRLTIAETGRTFFTLTATGLLLLALPLEVAAQPAKTPPPSSSAKEKSAKSGDLSAEGKVIRRKRLPSMDIDDPKISETEAKNLGDTLRKKKNYLKVLRNGSSDAVSLATMRDWVRWRVYSLTIKTNRSSLHKQSRKLLNEVKGAARLLKKISPQAALVFRRRVCREVTDRSIELLDNNFFVRLNAVVILSQLNEVEGDSAKRKLPVAYAPVIDALIDKVLLAKQPDAIKIPAANGLFRLALLGKPTGAQLRSMAKALITLSQDNGIQPWLQMRVARALGAVGLKHNLNGQATIIQALTKMMIDEARPQFVRCEAARALGRAEYENDVNKKLITYEIVGLARWMAARYNATYKAKAARGRVTMTDDWKTDFLNLYLAFKPVNSNETKIYGGRKVGLLRKFPTDGNVKKPFELLKPIVSHVVQQPIGKSLKNRRGGRQVYTYYPIGTNLINGLDTWQAANVPSTKRIQSVLPPIRPTMKAAFVGPANGIGENSR